MRTWLFNKLYTLHNLQYVSTMILWPSLVSKRRGLRGLPELVAWPVVGLVLNSEAGSGCNESAHNFHVALTARLFERSELVRILASRNLRVRPGSAEAADLKQTGNGESLAEAT